jgi:hypothetical protein
MFSCLDIFVLDNFPGINDEPPQHYRPPNRTWNAYRLDIDLNTSSQQLAITTHLTHNYCTLLLLRFGNSKIVSDWYHDCLNVVNDGNHLRELRNLVYHSAVLGSLNSEIKHFWFYVDINYFCYLHTRNSFLKLCCVFFKHSVEWVGEDKRNYKPTRRRVRERPVRRRLLNPISYQLHKLQREEEDQFLQCVLHNIHNAFHSGKKKR